MDISFQEHLRRAIRYFGSVSLFAAALGVSRQNVYHWLKRTKKFPLERCQDIETATNGFVTKAQLRPDFFNN